MGIEAVALSSKEKPERLLVSKEMTMLEVFEAHAWIVESCRLMISSKSSLPPKIRRSCSLSHVDIVSVFH